MLLKKLQSEINQKGIKVLFVDYYDTIVHRTVHPNYTLRIWAKLMIRELGLNISIDELYFIRQQSTSFLAKKQKKSSVELSYKILKEHVCMRLMNENHLDKHKIKDFINFFENADLISEVSVQYLNNNILDFLKEFKKNGGQIYLVSDFYSSKSLFEGLLKNHGINDLFDDVYSSASLGKSKETGDIFNHIISLMSIKKETVMMIGDNKNSDFLNANKAGLNSFLLPHKKYLKRNRKKSLGNDKRNLKRIINNTQKDYKSSKNLPYVDYAIFYHFFTERLYYKCRKDGVKDLFFLAREGQFLKRMFDSYQKLNRASGIHKVNTHYIKMSRQSSLQIHLKDIEHEDFDYLNERYPNLDLESFLSHLNCPSSIKITIAEELKTNLSLTIKNFFNSELFLQLKDNKVFINFYNDHRNTNYDAFQNYLNSFGVDYEKSGIYVVDIGWAGTMQESIHTFLHKKIPVTGYYFGVTNIYNIEEKTKRYGLLFSILPYANYYDHLLNANTQLYEQFASADHGSAIAYSNEVPGFVIENHNDKEKWLYYNYIQELQNQMFKYHLSLNEGLKTICYNQNLAQKVISQKALEIGLFQKFKHLKFMETLSSGFYQNLGNNEIGINYSNTIGRNIFKNIISFILTPELVFRYIIKLEPILYPKSKILAFLVPKFIIHKYFILNKIIRFNFIHKYFLLKEHYFNNHQK
ncbi:HAD family hydrolase [Mariniflexile soesokkakense]|uniref:HAD family hydrolase n=1 Tax=Mariniflexile soesokkakense TaxID=1343160 RepID=A0ABV0AB93_9FLAO